MAEFQEVMKQWNRMCGKQGHCYACPADGPCPTDGPCSPVSDLCTNVEKITALEKVIMQWAAEHPEPVYPKWWEWLADQGILTCDKTYPNMRYWYALNKDKVEQPIPADIAQKLGIEPKEG